MSTLIKYRVHEVAKDFKLGTKEITQILTDYASTPKNHMQVLEDNELDLIFEYLTQHNQMADLSEVFAVKEAPKKQEAPVSSAAEASGKHCVYRRNGSPFYSRRLIAAGLVSCQARKLFPRFLERGELPARKRRTRPCGKRIPARNLSRSELRRCPEQSGRDALQKRRD